MRALVLLVTVVFCSAACHTLVGGPPDTFWRWDSRPDLAFARWQDEEPVGRLSLVRTERPPPSPFQDMPAIDYRRPSFFFTWNGGSTVYEFVPMGVHRNADGSECFRFHREE